ncbi:MAG: ABC transporter ATP-binding protein [Tissierellia bacterium]|nr:ABC transporter ATP-binding protein [Tissierellia bacterium]
MSKLVEIKDLYSYYGGICALNGVSLYINEGEITSIVGSNGAGKSTLMRTIAGDKQIDSGEILMNGEPLPKLVHDVVNSGISLVPEGRHIFPALSVRENLILGTCALKGQEYKRAMSETLEEVISLFPILGKRIKQSGGTLSGGEQQMLAIGRALMAHPKLLCLDEPSLGLAPIIIDEVFDKIIQLNKEKKLTVLLVEQNAYLALDVSDRAYVLNTGLITLEGTGKELAENPSVQEEYLGVTR